MSFSLSNISGTQIQKDSLINNLTVACDPGLLAPSRDPLSGLPNPLNIKKRDGKSAIAVDICDLDVSNLVIHGHLKVYGLVELCDIFCPTDFTVTASNGAATMVLGESSFNNTSLLLGKGGNQSGVTLGALGEPLTGISFPNASGRMFMSVAGPGVNNPALRMDFQSTTDAILMQSGDVAGTVGLPTTCLTVTADTGTTPTTPGIKIGSSGTICALTRASATAANSWEDGLFGNSAAMVFTPDDFLSDQTAGRKHFITLSLFGVQNFYVSQSADAGAQYLSIKMIPKGFAITRTDIVTVYATGTFPGAGGIPDVRISAARLGDPSNELSSTGTVPFDSITIQANAPDVSTLVLTALAADIIGDGQTMVVLAFIPGAGVTMNMAGQGLLGASITMSRV